MNKAGRPPLHIGCKIDGCDGKHLARGYCNSHYKRQFVRSTDVTAATITERAAERLEDVRWMAETGEHLTGAAQRLGLKRNTLEVWLTRHDRDTLAVLIAREPRDHNRVIDGMSVSELTGQRARRTRRREREKSAA